MPKLCSIIRTALMSVVLSSSASLSAQETEVPPSTVAPAPAPPQGQAGEIIDLSAEQALTPNQTSTSQPVPPAEPVSSRPAPTQTLGVPDSGPASTGSYRANGVHLSLLGLTLGRFRLNYERFVAAHHGLVVEAILNPNLLDRFSPDTDDASDPKRFLGYGAGLGYRWHWRGEQGGFVSAMAALEHGSGSMPVLGDPDIRWSGTLTTLSITPAVGGRWVWDSGFSMVLRGGIGYAHQWVDNDPGLEEKAIDQYENQFLSIEGEFSLGYAF